MHRLSARPGCSCLKETFPLDSWASAGCSAGPQIEPDNKEILQLKVFPVSVPRGWLYDSRTCIIYQVLDSIWGGRIKYIIHCTAGEKIDMTLNKCIRLCELMLGRCVSTLVIALQWENEAQLLRHFQVKPNQNSVGLMREHFWIFLLNLSYFFICGLFSWFRFTKLS